METILAEIQRALNAKLYYLAVALSLTLPDICAALEAANGDTSGSKYKNWYNRYLASTYRNITAEDCWSLRCGVLHQGRFGHGRMQYARVIFTIPGHGPRLHNNIMNDALNLDAVQFCQDVTNAVRTWYCEKSKDTNVVANLPNLMRYRTNGIEPYIVGMPVIS
jgi:hypothetical protein